jgi:hypothetical protein
MRILDKEALGFLGAVSSHFRRSPGFVKGSMREIKFGTFLS